MVIDYGILERIIDEDLIVLTPYFKLDEKVMYELFPLKVLRNNGETLEQFGKRAFYIKKDLYVNSSDYLNKINYILGVKYEKN